MFGFAAPLLKDGGAFVLWAHDAEEHGVEVEVRTAARRLSLAPVAILGEGGLCLTVYTKMESQSAAVSASTRPLQRLSRSRSLERSSPSTSGNQRKVRTNRKVKGRSKLAGNVNECEERIAKVSARIAELRETQAGASNQQRPQIDSQIEQLEAHRVALAEQLGFQKSLLSASLLPTPAEQDRARLLAAYEREDQHGTNEEARRLLADHPPALDDLQSELVSRLNTEGVAEVELARLFSPDSWKEVAAEAAAFARETEGKLAAEPERPGESRPRQVIRRHGRAAELPLEDPWLQIALSPRLLAVVNAYLGMWGKLTHCNQVYKAAPPEGVEPWEKWHRDAQDKRLVRVILHLSDVQTGADQLECVPGSTGEGPYAALWPWTPGGRRLPPAEEFAERIPDAAIRTLNPSPGTIVLWNASGLHREGFTARGPQVLWKCSYSSPASLLFTERRFGVQLPERCDLSEAARFAVS
jgi:hypothetical protein